MTTDIKPDTSLYPNDLPSRFRALALIAEGHANGKTVQGIAIESGPVWRDVRSPTWLDDLHYRLKPEPRVVWVNFNETEYGELRSNVYESKISAESSSPGSQKRIATAVRVELPE